VQRKWKLWTAQGRAELEELPLLPYAAARRGHRLHWLEELNREISELDRRVGEEVQGRRAAVRLMTHPGVGPVTASAMVLTVGPVGRFANADPRSRGPKRWVVGPCAPCEIYTRALVGTVKTVSARNEAPRYGACFVPARLWACRKRGQGSTMNAKSGRP